MKRWYLAFGLAFVIAAMPAACERGEADDDDEMGEMGEMGEMEEANEADEASEMAEAASETPEAQAVLLARALIDEATASKTALGHVANGKITRTELEEEDGKLIWSFDIEVAGKAGIEEVHVDAMTGEIIKTEHEEGGDESTEGHS